MDEQQQKNIAAVKELETVQVRRRDVPRQIVCCKTAGFVHGFYLLFQFTVLFTVFLFFLVAVVVA